MTFSPVPRYYDPALTATVGPTTVIFAKGQGLQMSFSVERSITPTPDTARVSIANLDTARTGAMLALFAAAGPLSLQQLRLQGGYSGALTGFFGGDLRKFTSARVSGSDIYTDVLADDGGNAVADVVIPTHARSTLARNPTDLAGTALALINSSGKSAPITLAPSAAEILAAGDQSRSYYQAVTIGKVTDLLDEMARRLYCRWRIRDQQLHLSSLYQADKNRPALVLLPEIITGEISFGGSGELEVSLLFDPNLVPGGQVVYLNSAFRVDHVVHSGSTRGGLWTSTIRGKAL